MIFLDSTSKNMDLNEIWDNIFNWCMNEGIRALIALVVLFICFKLTNFIFNRVGNKLKKSKTDKTVEKVIISIGKIAIKVLLLVIFVSFIGIDTSGIVAIIAATAVAIGLALQGTLSNLASGVLIIILRPFKVGDYIECSDLTGFVEDIGLFQTRIVTFDNKVIIISNSIAVNSIIINHTMKKLRNAEIIFSISYENDFRKAKYLIEQEIAKTGFALPDKEPFVNVYAHNTSSIDIITRVWIKNDDFWEYYWMMLENVKLSFDKNGVSIPYTQMDVHLKKDENVNPIWENDEYVKRQIAIDEKNKKLIYELKAKRDQEELMAKKAKKEILRMKKNSTNQE